MVELAIISICRRQPAEASRTVMLTLGYSNTLVFSHHVFVGIVWVILFLLHRLDGLPDTCRCSHSNRVWRNAFRHHRARCYGRAPANPYAWQNDNVATNPAVIFDTYWVTKLDKFNARQHAGLVAGAVDVDIRSTLHSVSQNDEAGIQDSKAVPRISLCLVRSSYAPIVRT